MHKTLICSPQHLNSQLSATYLPTNHTIRLRSNDIRSVTAEPIERTLTKMQDEREREKLTGRPSKVAAAASALHHPLRVWCLALSMWRAHDNTTMRSDALPRDVTQSKAAMAKAMRLGFGGQTVSLALSCSPVGSRSRTRHLLCANCLRRPCVFHPHSSIHVCETCCWIPTFWAERPPHKGRLRELVTWECKEHGVKS
jgi:hypothetical protein